MGATAKRKSVMTASVSKRTDTPALEASSVPRESAEQYAAGKALRASCPRESHATWKPGAGRRDAVELVLAAEQGRVPDLLPLRHGRMVRSAHARAGSAALLSGYMGRSDAFDKALAAFSFAYADQNEADHGALARAVTRGSVAAVSEKVS